MNPTAADLKELKRILAFGTTPDIESFLRAEVAHLSQMFPEAETETEAPAAPKLSAPPRKIYEAITSYAFSDLKDTAKIIISDIAGLSEAIVEFTPTERGFFITVLREAQGLSNIRLTVSPLKKIVPGSSHYTTKGTTLTVILAKKKSTTWSKLKKTTSGIKKSKPGEKAKEDPNTALMDMKKKKYDEGDDEMKRTMQKAWWEAQHKKDQEKNSAADN
jgi:calcyclin binding protein